ncbi:hypothetical protein SDC9_56197 [bioreactor metagenome]|uniref:Uncharacterized protein n=1 Tax=bioreactor metagenome TaxID=1076179 RepID=A0A644X6U0_9ZZZZ
MEKGISSCGVVREGTVDDLRAAVVHVCYGPSVPFRPVSGEGTPADDGAAPVVVVYGSGIRPDGIVREGAADEFRTAGHVVHGCPGAASVPREGAVPQADVARSIVDGPAAPFGGVSPEGTVANDCLASRIVHSSAVLLRSAGVGVRPVRAPAGDGEAVQYSRVGGCRAEGAHHGVAVLALDARRRLRHAVAVHGVVSRQISSEDRHVFPEVPLPCVGLSSREPAVECHPRLQGEGSLPVRRSARSRNGRTVLSLCDPDLAPRRGIVEGRLELRLAAGIRPGRTVPQPRSGLGDIDHRHRFPGGGSRKDAPRRRQNRHRRKKNPTDSPSLFLRHGTSAPFPASLYSGASLPRDDPHRLSDL